MRPEPNKDRYYTMEEHGRRKVFCAKCNVEMNCLGYRELYNRDEALYECPICKHRERF